MTGDDYIFLPAYENALRSASERKVNQVIDLYIDHLDKSFDFSESYFRYILGREVKQILLLHASRLNAVCFDRIIELARKRAYSFIELSKH